VTSGKTFAELYRWHFQDKSKRHRGWQSEVDAVLVSPCGPSCPLDQRRRNEKNVIEQKCTHCFNGCFPCHL